MKNKLLLFLMSFVLTFIQGCGGASGTPDHSATTNVIIPVAAVTDESLYIESFRSNSEGQVDVTEIMVAHGYADPLSKDTFLVEAKDSSGQPLPNIDVAIWVDKDNDKINLRFQDPSGTLATLYHHASLSNLKNIPAQKYAANPGFLVRFIAQVVIRSLIAYDTASTIASVYQLFNVELHYEQSNEEIVFEGKVSDFYTLFSGLISIKHLPFALARNIRKVGNLATAKGAIKFDDTIINYALLDFLKEMGGYVASNVDTEIRVVLHTFDKNNGFFSIELINESNIDNNSSGELYDITLEVNGKRAHSFDPPILGAAPEFRGTVVVRNLSFNLLSANSSYAAQGVVRNVPISQGETIEVIITDQDITYDEDISRFRITFDGTDQIVESDYATTKIKFVKSGDTPTDSSVPKYDMRVNIQGFTDQVYDGFYSPPDFSGEIIISGEYFYIQEKMNSYLNSQVIQNIPIKIGETIQVSIVDEDNFYPDPIMSFSFTFDGKSIRKENVKAIVDIGFIAMELLSSSQ